MALDYMASELLACFFAFVSNVVYTGRSGFLAHPVHVI